MRNGVVKALKVQTVLDDAFQPSSQPSTFTIILKFFVGDFFGTYDESFFQNHDKKVSAIIENQKFHATVSFIIVIGWRFTIIFFPDNIAAGRFAH